MLRINLIEWRDVIGTQGNYRVSDTGLVFSNKSDRVMSPGYAGGSHPKDRYEVVGIYYGTGKAFRKNESVHKLVANAFIGPCPAGHMIDHINGDYRDNRPSNLRYVTAQGNSDNTVRLNRQAKGEDANKRKLTEPKVREIQKLTKAGSLDADVAAQFGVSKTLIRLIRIGVRWKHVQPLEVN